jgi:hypothetical protein
MQRRGANTPCGNFCLMATVVTSVFVAVIVLFTFVYVFINMGGDKERDEDIGDLADKLRAKCEEFDREIASIKETLKDKLPTTEEEICIEGLCEIFPRNLNSLNLIGCWDANTNTPIILSSVGNDRDAYLVCTGGITTIDGEDDWERGDLLIFIESQGAWIKNDGTPVDVGNGDGGDGGDCPLATWTPEYSTNDVNLEGLPDHRIAFWQPVDNGDILIEVSASQVDWDDRDPPSQPRFNMTGFPVNPTGLPTAIYWTELRRNELGPPPNLDEAILAFETFYPPNTWELSVDHTEGASAPHDFHFMVTYTPDGPIPPRNCSAGCNCAGNGCNCTSGQSGFFFPSFTDIFGFTSATVPTLGFYTVTGTRVEIEINTVMEFSQTSHQYKIDGFSLPFPSPDPASITGHEIGHEEGNFLSGVTSGSGGDIILFGLSPCVQCDFNVHISVQYNLDCCIPPPI